MTALDEIAFDGVPFDGLPPAGAAPSAPAAAPLPAAMSGHGTAAALAAVVVRRLRDAALDAHRAATDAQVRHQERLLGAVSGTRVTPGPERHAAPPRRGDRLGGEVAARRITWRAEGALEPLATTPVDRLDAAALARLAAGRAGEVFGPAYDQPAPPVGGPLAAVGELRPGGPSGAGVLRATLTAGTVTGTDLRAAAGQAAGVLAVWLGLHLCVPDPRLAVLDEPAVEHDPDAGRAPELVAEVVDAGLVPRPWLRLDADLRDGGVTVGRVRGLVVAVHEPDGTPMGTRRGGNPPARPARRGTTGAFAVVDELALATASTGDLTLALGPEFARYTAVRATRPPAGGLRLVGRVMGVRGTRGDLSGGATGETEFDCAADAWYFGAAPSPTVPNVVLMETSLQSALLLGYHLGATLVDAGEDYCLRNLDGSATLHREVDLRGATIRQRSTLLSTTVLAGAVLQGFSYELRLDGDDAPFYTGQSLFGFFTAATLANQTGLDNGADVPTWLAAHPAVARRVALPGLGPLHLLEEMTVVDGGGRHGAGYLHATRPVAADDWYFARHFHLDPVMPGSLGVEAVVQALQGWLRDSGALDGFTDPEFVVPAGVELTWRYRGQILAADGELTLEVHVRGVERRPGRVRVVADASVWKPGLRIYELTAVAAEAREKGAPPW